MLVELSDIQYAHEQIRPYIRRTPTIKAAHMTTAPKSPYNKLWLKLELHQITGSFKVRGATNKRLSLPDDALKNGLVTASGGNHGKAVAYVGSVAKAPTRIYVPSSIPPDKIERIQSYGAEVIVEGDVYDQSNIAAMEYAEKSGAQYIHAFDDPAIIAGQGTVGLEIIADAPAVDVVIVAIGGGGLISGVSTVMKHHGIRVIGVEPVGAPTLKTSVKEGKVIELEKIESKVGTLSPLKSAEINLQHVQENVDDIVLVTDEEMLQAAQWLWSEFGISAELSGAAATAALLTGKALVTEQDNVCVLVCGSGSDGIPT